MAAKPTAYKAGMAAFAAFASLAMPAASASAQAAAAAVLPSAAAGPSYADIVDLADAAPLVLRAEIRKVARLDAARAAGVAPGKARLYVEARTQALLLGKTAIGESLRYLVDVPLDARGKVPSLRKASVLLFARPVPHLPGELQLVAPDAQIAWTPDTEARVRAALAELLAPGAPQPVRAVREAIHVPGTLAGTGETQFFLQTSDASAASITVLHRAGQPPAWSASFTEVLENADGPPRRETLAWYRLACFLAPTLPAGVNLSEGADAKARAEEDWRFVMTELGSCPRARSPG